jgi:hypothetical protein
MPLDDLTQIYAANKQQAKTTENDQWLQQIASPVATPGAGTKPAQEQAGKPSKASKAGLGERAKDFLGQQGKSFLEGLKGEGEAALAVGTQLETGALSSVAGVGSGIIWEENQAEKLLFGHPFSEDIPADAWSKAVEKKFPPYQPQTVTGKALTGIVDKLMNLPMKPAQALGELAGQLTGNPNTKTLVTNIGGIATMFMLPEITKGVKGRFSIKSPEGAPAAEVEAAPSSPDGDGPGGGAPSAPVPKTKGQRLEAARGDLTADMEKVNERAHAEIHKALKQIPEEEWKKFAGDEKPKNIEDLSTLLDEHAKRMQASRGTPDYEKLPQHYKDVMDREEERARQGADNLEQIAAEAKKAKASLLIVPGTLAERTPGVTPERGIGDIARDLKTVLTHGAEDTERGEVGPRTLSPEETANKQAAADRLKADFGTIKRNAARAGKNIGDYLADMGFDPETVRLLGAGAKDPEHEGMPELRVNLDRIANTEDVKNVISDVNRQQQASGRIEETTRGVRGHEVTVAASQTKRGGVTVEDILNRKPGEMWNAEQITAARDIRDGVAVQVKGLTDAVLSGDAEAAKKLPATMALLGEVEAQRTGASAEIGRALESHKILSTADRQPYDPKQLADLAQKVRDSGGDPKVLAARIKALETPEELGSFARQVAGLSKLGKMSKDIFLHCWINGMLSGPVTHARVAVSNLATLGVSIGESQMAYGIGKVREMLGGEPGQSFNEAGAKVEGLISGFQDALNVAAKSWKTNHPEFGKGRPLEDNPNPLAKENLGTDGAWGNFLEWTGNVIGAPGRALMTEHQFATALQYRAQLHVEALKEAVAEGLTGKALSDRVNYIKEHPETFPSLHDAAREYGLKQGFLNELGPVGQKVQQLSNASVFTKMVVPFVKIPLNLFKYGYDRTPALQMISRSYWSDISAGGATADAAMARTGTAIMATAAIAYLAHQGLVTGAGPENADLKRVWREHHQPYSVKVGDRWVSYKALGPLAMPLAATSEVMELVDEHSLDKGVQYLSAAALAATQLAEEQPYMQGLSNFVNMLHSGGNLGGRAEKYLQDFSGSMIPALSRNINKTYFDRTMREVQSIADSIKASVPGLSQSLPPRRGFWGQRIVPDGALGPDLLSPFTATKATHDAVDEEILKNQVAVGMPRQVIGGSMPSGSPLQENQPKASAGVKLTPKQYDDYVVFCRKEGKDGEGRNLKEALKDLIESSPYEEATDGPDGSKALYIKDTVRQFDTRGQQMLLEKYPDLRDKMLKQQQAKIQAMMPGRKASEQ